MKTCWAACLGGCSDGLSREHLVSASVWNAPTVTVEGFPWCQEKPKDVGLAAITSKILCSKHNSDLSPTDGAAKALAEVIRKACAIADRRANDRQRKWKVLSLFLKEPWLLERWFLKTAINITTVRGGPTPPDSPTTLYRPPVELVRLAFGLTRFEAPMGLYALAGLQEEVPLQDSVVFAPLWREGTTEIVGSVFGFHGLRFILNLTPRDLPPALVIPGSKLMSGGDANRIYHIQHINFKVGRHLSHRIQLLWHRQHLGVS